MKQALSENDTTARFTAADLHDIGAVLRSKAGMSPSAVRIERRADDIEALACDHGVHSAAEFVAKISEPASNLFQHLVELVAVHETYFFRGKEQFEFIGRRILPELVSNSSAVKPIRYWSAGCATGEETYSLAILLNQTLPTANGLVLGTDISQSAVEKAKRGVYGAWSFREVRSDGLHPHLEPHGKSVCVSKRISAITQFEAHNLLSPESAIWSERRASFDLILLRNVLIYFTPEAIEHVMSSMLRYLAPGGWLITGPSDPILHSPALEAQIATEGVAYRKRSGAPAITLAPATHLVDKVHVRDLSYSFALPRTEPSHASLVQATDSHRISSNQRPALSKVTSIAARPTAAPFEKMLSDFQRGDFQTVVRQTETAGLGLKAYELRAESLANLGKSCALAEIGRLLVQFPMSARLHYLRALLLFGQRQLAAATIACRDLLYVDPSCASARMLLGEIQLRGGDVAGANRSFRNALAVLGQGAELGLNHLTNQSARAELEALALARLTL